MQRIIPNWPAPANVKALTTTREGGVSQVPYNTFNLATHVGDDADAVKNNRQILIEELNLPSEPIWLNQVHSTIAINAATVSNTPTADASFTNRRNVVCAVLTADCLPILICDKAGTMVAAIHAGWRGLANGIIEATINKFSVKHEDLLVWLGPAIGPNMYEVGADVVKEFTKHDPAAIDAFIILSATKWLVNLYQLASMRLKKLGITHIYGGDHCTYTEQNLFYSFRRSNKTGRMASLIWMENI
jgi:YfiH family protein